MRNVGYYIGLEFGYGGLSVWVITLQILNFFFLPLNLSMDLYGKFFLVVRIWEIGVHVEYRVVVSETTNSAYFKMIRLNSAELQMLFT